MLVIMDMEWIETAHRICPTQLSAVWVNQNWYQIGRLDYLIQPFSLEEQKWNHIAYTGHTASDFLSGATAIRVMKNLVSRLAPDDVLCWWSVSTAVTFIALYKILLMESPVNQMRLISPALSKYKEAAGISSRGSAYVMANELGIPLFEQEHCSADDANVIRMLMEHLNVRQEDVLASLLPDGAMDKTIQQIRRPPYSSSSHIDNSVHPYMLDLKNRMIHSADCSKIKDRVGLKGVGTMKQAFSRHCEPCGCCKQAYWEYSRKKAAERIESMQISFVYSEKNKKLFHKPSCIHVGYIPLKKIKGARRYNTCIDHGYQPCGWCKPKPLDEKETIHVYNLRKTDNPAMKDQWASTRTLSRLEQNALKRHAAAVKERATIPNNLTGTESHDAHVLSQSGFAFWAAEGYQTFHLRHCPKLNHLSNLHGYSRFAQAQSFGLTPCKLCKPSKKNDIVASVPIYQKKRENESFEKIDVLCDRQGWNHSRNHTEYWIETPVGIWKMILGTQPITVYHINKVKTPGNTTGFHKQQRLFLSMTDTVEYIRRHDETLINREKEQQEKKSSLRIDELTRIARYGLKDRISHLQNAIVFC